MVYMEIELQKIYSEYFSDFPSLDIVGTSATRIYENKTLEKSREINLSEKAISEIFHLLLGSGLIANK